MSPEEHDQNITIFATKHATMVAKNATLRRHSDAGLRRTNDELSASPSCTRLQTIAKLQTRISKSVQSQQKNADSILAQLDIHRRGMCECDIHTAV